MHFETDLLTELARIAHRMADAARPETLRHFRAPDLAADNKQDAGFDPVTEGDRAAERAMRDILAEERPRDGIDGEEYGTTAGRSGLRWVLDPIDGTRAYLAGAPTWGTLIGVGGDDGPVLGIIDQPHIGERFFGAPGTAWLDGPHGRHALAPRATHHLSGAILFTTFPEVGSKAEGAAFHTLSRHCRLTRYGIDCYAYGLLAAGHCDLVVEAGLHSYDIWGPMAVIQAAGGIVTDWRGGPAHRGGRVVAAANAALHEEALAHLRDVP